MLARLAALAFALVLIGAAPANAAPGDDAGLYAGERTWGVPKCGVPQLEVSTPMDYLAAHDTGVFEAEPDAWADDVRCVIVLNPRVVIHTAAKRCHVIVHEWGHLAGREHSDNPRSVMYGEDEVTESRIRVKRRWRWEQSGAFRPCADLTAPGASFG